MIQKFVVGALVDVDLMVAGNPRSYADATLISSGSSYLEILDSTSVNRVHPWYQVVNITLK